MLGLMFAVLENLQYAANKQDSIRSSYMNAASSTPSTVFSTVLKLSNSHYAKLAKEKKGRAAGVIIPQLPYREDDFSLFLHLLC